ncbi:MAG: DUF131 domain-containing protein [Candidatus Lokiarchaeota archaeon]|nr:DUF131 domain-containing protein [Candidatus Lokiarchaeota archaeon]
MQSIFSLQILSMAIIIVGIILIILGIIQSNKNGQHDSGRTDHKGIILIGPIPIVWGFGDKGKIIMAILFVAFISYIILVLY